MAEMDFWRQAGIVPEKLLQDLKVTVIGVGGIGSPTTIALAKMGVGHITVFDNDTVTSHNLPNQMYRFEDLGQSKVVALADIAKRFSGCELEAVEELFTNQRVEGIVISGVDSMEARQKIWTALKYKPQENLYIDARMGGQTLRIYTVNPCSRAEIAAYETTLYTDAQAAEDPCTERSIIYTVLVTAAFIANQIKVFLLKEPLCREILFDFPTFTLLANSEIPLLSRKS